ncbi:hypothetical protein V8C86DRAFT_2884511 [Haematococcus lacustris]
MGTPLLINFFGLDLWSLLTSWGSGIQALLESQQPPSLQELSAPGICASQLLALNTTALLNTSLTPQELMPGLDYFAMDSTAPGPHCTSPSTCSPLTLTGCPPLLAF